MAIKSKAAGAFVQGTLEALAAYGAALGVLVSVKRVCYFGGHIAAALAIRLAEVAFR